MITSHRQSRRLLRTSDPSPSRCTMANASSSSHYGYREIRLSYAMPISVTYGVNAPGTANKIIFLFALNSAMLILFAGESSNSSTLGILSPSWKRIQKRVKTMKNAKTSRTFHGEAWPTRKFASKIRKTSGKLLPRHPTNYATQNESTSVLP